MGALGYRVFRVQCRGRVDHVAQYGNAILLRSGMFYESGDARLSNCYEFRADHGDFTGSVIGISTTGRVTKVFIIHRRRATIAMQFFRR